MGGWPDGRRVRRLGFGFFRGDWRWGWLRLGGFGRGGFGGVLRSGGLQLAEDFVRAVVHAVEAGVAAGSKSHRTGFVGLRGIGFRELDATIAVGEFL